MPSERATNGDRATRRLVAVLSSAAQRARASPWASTAGRALAMVVALVALAGIGRAASADPSASASSTMGAFGAGDAGSGSTVALGPVPPEVRAPPASPPAVAGPELAPPAQGATSRATPTSPVHLNAADETELRRLPGVGPKRAQAILALRTRMGRFQRVEDLLRVKGVGRATLRKWRPLVTLEPPPARAVADGGAEG